MVHLIDLDQVAVGALPRLAVGRVVVEVRRNDCMIDQSIVIDDSRPKSNSILFDGL